MSFLRRLQRAMVRAKNTNKQIRLKKLRKKWSNIQTQIITR